jgi:hypothetical protein
MKKPRPFSVGEFVIGAGLVNAVINVFFGWFAILPPATALPLFAFGRPSVIFDLVAMAFCIASGTSFVVTKQVRAQAQRGELIAPVLGPRALAYFAKWPEYQWRRAAQCGAVAVALFVPLPLLALIGSGIHEIDKTPFLVWKALFSFVEGGVVTPVIAAGALAPRAAPALSNP